MQAMIGEENKPSFTRAEEQIKENI